MSDSSRPLYDVLKVESVVPNPSYRNCKVSLEFPEFDAFSKDSEQNHWENRQLRPLFCV